MRTSVIAALLGAFVFSACTDPVNSGALKVEVSLHPHLVASCMKVKAFDSARSEETRGVPFEGRSKLLVGIGSSIGLAQPFSVQAVGYFDDCVAPTGEQSEVASAKFSTTIDTISLLLAPVEPDGGTTGGGGGSTGGGGGTGGGVSGGGAGGGISGGGGGTLDTDGDGSPNVDDCADTDPLVRPGIPERCGNAIDDNCDGKIDCAEASCAGMACAGNGTCVGQVCMAAMELCTDGVDNDGDLQVDCADPDCATQSCADRDACTDNDTCVSGACVGTPRTCNSPGVCQAPAGTCQADGGLCSYAPLTGTSCTDNDPCTDNDSCSSGTCVGTPRVCTTTNQCLGGGACSSGTCTFTPLATGPCNDGKNCTINDTCDGDGGCTGTPVVCTPNQCQEFATDNCSDGACVFTARTGACDAGVEQPGTCVNQACQAPLFPYVPSNFSEAQLPTQGFTVPSNACTVTINTTLPEISATCFQTYVPPHRMITPPGGVETMLLSLATLDLPSGVTLVVVGSRPLILAVRGDANVGGTIIARNGADLQCNAALTGSNREGGGGGGFGSAGGNGGNHANSAGATSGTNSLVPLRGGCRGGAGSGGAGGAGGGALQLSVVGALTLTGTITAPGRGAALPSTDNDASGGGGGSGGALLIEASTVTVTSTARVTANGGSGAGGNDGSARGAQGNDGAQASASVAGGGAGGAPAGGDGGNGAAGNTNATSGGSVTNDGGGGGGGGVGRIRVRGTCSIDAAAVFSPARQGGC